MLKVRLAEAPLVQAIVVGFGLFVLVRLIDQTIGVLLLFVSAFVLSAAIAPVVRALRELRLPPNGWRLPVGVAVLVVFLLTAAILIVAGYAIGGLLAGELVVLGAQLPLAASALAAQVDQLARSANVPPAAFPSPSQLGQQTQGVATDALSVAGALVTGMVQFVINLVIILTLATFLVVESASLRRFWVGLFPPRHQARARAVADQIGHEMGGWLLGQVAMSTAAGVLAGALAWALGVPFPVLVGVLSALFQLIPVFSTLTMTIPVFFLGLSQSPEHAVIDAAAFFILAQVDGSVLYPMIAGRAVRLSPVLVATAIPLGAALDGATGAILSIPIAVALRVVVDEVVLPWLHRQEGVPTNVAPELAPIETSRTIQVVSTGS